MNDRNAGPFASLSAGQEESLYRLIAETIPHMVWTARPDGALEYFNERIFEYTGRSQSELAGAGWQQVIHPEHLPICIERWTRSLASGDPYEIEYRLRRHDGEFRWHLGSARPLRDADGRIFRWFGTCTDIDDRLRAHGETEARFRSLINQSTDFYWETDAEHRFIVLDVGGRSNPGFFAASRIGRTRWEVPSVKPDAEGWRAHRALLDAGRPFRDFETARPTADGTVRHYSVSGEPVFDARGVLRGYRGIGHEITARKHAEQALRESEERYRNITELSQDAIVVRRDGRIAYANPAAVRLFGVDGAQDLLGRRLRELTHPDDRALVSEREQSIDTRRMVLPPVELRLRRADGSYAEVEGVAAPIEFDGERAVLAVFRDLGARRKAERAVRDYSARVRQLLRHLAELQETERRNLAVSLHDLTGQNLTALGIGLEIVRGELPVGSAALCARLNDMSKLVEQTVASIRDVMSELRPPALDDYGLLPALHAYAQQFQSRTGLRTLVTGTLPPRLLPGDHKLAALRVVQEALANAAKHSGATSITIDVSRQPAGVRIAVEDNGRGLAEPLGARSLMRGGWGLPLMRERAEAIGGALRLESMETGTRVVLEIPVADQTGDAGHDDDPDHPR